MPPEPPTTSSSRPDNSPAEPFPVVGIGASAGGLEAFSQLVSRLSADTGMAFVLVQHLAPKQKSLLGEIIARITPMPVQEATNGLVVEPNHVYVIPPNAILTIASGCLQLRPREAKVAPRTVDTFLSALAVERGSKAIGVILSGGDGDGAVGLKAVKAAGGITFAQSETSAQVQSMPHIAIATGQVDFIMSPVEIAQTLIDISRHPYVTHGETATPDESAVNSRDALSTIFSLLKAATEVDFKEYKPTTLRRRIWRRMALYRMERLEDYVGYLQGNPEEVKALYQELLINVTGFFRDGGAFEVLKQEVFPTLMQGRRPDEPMRIWVPGCSTGEEAYSLAICLLEFLATYSRNLSIQIFATDISEESIDVARLGIYPASALEGVSSTRLQQYFVPTEGGYQINKVVRELCIFARQNLISDPPFSRLDMISCRNVLIYFQPSLQRRVLPMFHYGLKSQGFLMLGSSETVGEFANLFTLVNQKHNIYAKLSTSQRLTFDFAESTAAAEKPAAYSLAGQGNARELNLYSAADQVLLNYFNPVGVVVNGQLDIVQFRGQTSPYLEPAPGRASLNLLSMAKQPLRLDLRTVIYQAKQTGEAVLKESVPLREGNQLRQVRLEVLPFRPGDMGEHYYLVLFKDVPERAIEAIQPLETMAEDPVMSRYQQEIAALQQDLEATRSHMQSIIQDQEATNQELRAANEEILSSNEELQSTNEELQTAKEEIQATNEELSTINDELYRRNMETTQVSNDLQNLLANINFPVLMLGVNLEIRRFTPKAAEVFNLISTDVGRPFSNINHQLAVDDLEQQILEVISSLVPSSREIQDQAGHWYDLRIRPYRTMDNRIDGAVLVLVDVDTLRRNEELRAAREYAEAIVEAVPYALVVLNTDLRVVTANRAFYQTFGITPGETRGELIFDLGSDQWNLPELRSQLQEKRPQDQTEASLEVPYTFEDIGPKTMRLNVRSLPQSSGRRLILIGVDGTGQVEA